MGHRPVRVDELRLGTRALRAGSWIPGQQQRLCHLARGTWHQALAGVLAVSPGRQDDGPGHSPVEIAIYPDVVWLAAGSLQTQPGTLPRPDLTDP